MVEEKDTQNEAPSLTKQEVERLVEAIRLGDGQGSDIYAANFILLLDALAEEEDIDVRREYVLAAQRALVYYAPSFFTTVEALKQLSLETLRGDVKRVTVEIKPKTRGRRGK